ncbi:hypothetical protein OG840_59685 [Streptomyces sp. NBC_01764]|nr:hypothetical protein [Streptomyces sp. NBC_01764]
MIEERDAHGELFGGERLIHCVNAIEHAHAEGGTRAGALRLSHALKRERAGRTSDDVPGWPSDPVDRSGNRRPGLASAARSRAMMPGSEGGVVGRGGREQFVGRVRGRSRNIGVSLALSRGGLSIW